MLIGNVVPTLNIGLAEASKIYLDRHAYSKYRGAFEDPYLARQVP